jgi:phosphate transport system protein
MLRELHKIFQRKSLMEEALRSSCEMLEIDQMMFVGAMTSLRERHTAELDFDIYEQDRKVNQFECEVRQKVLTHLAVTGTADLNIGLVLASIVIDIERIGDYTKNMVDLAADHPSRLEAGEWESALKQHEALVANGFGKLIRALRESDESEAKRLQEGLWRVKRFCDECTSRLIHDGDLKFSRSDAVSLALYLRFLKRISAHLVNVATSITNPFDRLGYRVQGGRETAEQE